MNILRQNKDLQAEKTAKPSPKRSADATLSTQIAEELQAAIFAGEYEPGDRLNEAVIAARMNISRGPIREAVRILSGLGLVTAIPNRGVFIRQMSVGEIVEVSELRALIFGFAAESAAENRSEEDSRALLAIVDQMDEATENSERDRYYRLNLDFHAWIIGFANNNRAKRLYNDFVQELHLFRRRDFNQRVSMRKSSQEHRAIYDAIREGDRVRAGDLARQHILAGCQRMLRQMESP